MNKLSQFGISPSRWYTSTEVTNWQTKGEARSHIQTDTQTRVSKPQKFVWSNITSVQQKTFTRTTCTQLKADVAQTSRHAYTVSTDPVVSRCALDVAKHS